MKVNAYAKINLFLDITEKREDGYHLLQTAFRTIRLHDTLHIRKADAYSLTVKGAYASLTGSVEENLLTKVATFFRDEYAFTTPLAITLTKRIPVGAGLGGGSSDAAALIRAINRMGKLNLSDDALKKIALRFGADVPFFLKGGLTWGESVGEVLTPINRRLKGHVVLVYPRIHVATKDAYGALTANDFDKGYYKGFRRMLEDPLYTLDKLTPICYNVFENPLRLRNTALREVKDAIDLLAGTPSHMTGSGSAFFLLYRTWCKAFSPYRKLRKHLPDADVFLTGFQKGIT